MKEVEQSYENCHSCGTAQPYESMIIKNDSLKLRENTQKNRYPEYKMLILLMQYIFYNSFCPDMEDKVQYQSEERIMDIREHLQGLETQLNSLEHQHAQQQYINIDGLNNSESRFTF
jgi:hypothetical protein